MGSDAKREIAHLALVVKDYDEAIRFYVEKLDFQLLEDTIIGPEKRWVRVAPGNGSCSLVLAKAVGEEQISRIGAQTGGRVFLFLHTDDFWRDHELFKARGVEFIRPPAEEKYGTVAVFRDLYGNLWDLIQPTK